MNIKFNKKYIKEDKVDFIIDDDKEMNWLSKLNDIESQRLFIIIDNKVSKLWKSVLNKIPKGYIYYINSEESSKSFDSYHKLFSFLEENKCSLSDLVIAIGGGIIMDLVGFTCSTYMRSLRFIAVPTTLIAQVDAISAGKTCLNSKTKNIVGTFYYPLKVYININFLKTISKDSLRQGYSEIFKYGLLDSPFLLKKLTRYIENPNDDWLMGLISLTINTRVDIFKKHPLASNLGHTFGQAIEKLFDYKILHGDAISIGTVMSLHFSEYAGFTTDRIKDNIISKMEKIGLWTKLDRKYKINADNMLKTMLRDKKASKEYIDLVLIRDIGHPYKSINTPFYRVRPRNLRKFLKWILEDMKKEVYYKGKKRNLSYV